jgi:hypothetical protein
MSTTPKFRNGALSASIERFDVFLAFSMKGVIQIPGNYLCCDFKTTFVAGENRTNSPTGVYADNGFRGQRCN